MRNRKRLLEGDAIDSGVRADKVGEVNCLVAVVIEDIKLASGEGTLHPDLRETLPDVKHLGRRVADDGRLGMEHGRVAANHGEHMHMCIGMHMSHVTCICNVVRGVRVVSTGRWEALSLVVGWSAQGVEAKGRGAGSSRT